MIKLNELWDFEAVVNDWIVAYSDADTNTYQII